MRAACFKGHVTETPLNRRLAAFSPSSHRRRVGIRARRLPRGRFSGWAPDRRAQLNLQTCYRCDGRPPIRCRRVSCTVLARHGPDGDVHDCGRAPTVDGRQCRDDYPGTSRHQLHGVEPTSLSRLSRRRVDFRLPWASYNCDYRRWIGARVSCERCGWRSGCALVGPTRDEGACPLHGRFPD